MKHTESETMAANGGSAPGEGTYVFTLGDKMMKKAQSELSEKDKWRARDIQALRDKVKAHKGNKNISRSLFYIVTNQIMIEGPELSRSQT